MRRFTIMGFTEAELGFVLAALFVAVAMTAVSERDSNAANVNANRSTADSLQRELSTARNSIKLLRDSLATLEGKISTKTPQCWERGEPSAPIADIAVLGANLFALERDTVTIENVRERLSTFIERGDSLRCRFIVRARPIAGVDAIQHAAAVSQLRRHFDVNDRPR